MVWIISAVTAQTGLGCERRPFEGAFVTRHRHWSWLLVLVAAHRTSSTGFTGRTSEAPFPVPVRTRPACRAPCSRGGLHYRRAHAELSGPSVAPSVAPPWPPQWPPQWPLNVRLIAANNDRKHVYRATASPCPHETTATCSPLINDIHSNESAALSSSHISQAADTTRELDILHLNRHSFRVNRAQVPAACMR